MKNELRLLNLLCVIAALAFLGMAVANAITAGQLLTTDNLFITMVCLVMALVFGLIPLIQLKEEGRLPIPFAKRLGIRKPEQEQVAAASTPPLLDAKGRAVPPDVKSMLAHMGQAPSKE
jgi:hypothetical protein